jgi:hypothetical protein
MSESFVNPLRERWVDALYDLNLQAWLNSEVCPHRTTAPKYVQDNIVLVFLGPVHIGTHKHPLPSPFDGGDNN